ncbi:sigma-70 family RNA polymerase sigma factor [Microvirga sp. M2]|uniref:sigma-70 family RNA polymerase sigma factor n=1 Tax=Microvirga sp. M2 TaxID=3073270 RepID=UPI0039C1B7BC
MAAETPMKTQMLAAIPHLRAFAISLCGNIDRADDLVQGALLKGLSNLDKFQPGTSMQAWLFTILRNDFLTQARRRKREVEDPEGAWAEKVAVMPEQGARLDFADMLKALSQLPLDQREALLLVTAEGLTYEDAARICGTNIGTIKSRINRARRRLTELMNFDAQDDLGPDRLVKAALFMHISA